MIPGTYNLTCIARETEEVFPGAYNLTCITLDPSKTVKMGVKPVLLLGMLIVAALVCGVPGKRRGKW